MHHRRYVTKPTQKPVQARQGRVLRIKVFDSGRVWRQAASYFVRRVSGEVIYIFPLSDVISLASTSLSHDQ